MNVVVTHNIKINPIKFQVLSTCFNTGYITQSVSVAGNTESKFGSKRSEEKVINLIVFFSYPN